MTYFTMIVKVMQWKHFLTWATSVEASQSGSYPVLYSLWIQSHATSAMIQANKTRATVSASFLCDSLLNQSLA